MRRVFERIIILSGALLLAAGALDAQAPSMLYDHVHLAVPDPEAAARWYREHLGGEFIDGREDRLMIGTTRIIFQRGEDRTPSAGGAIDHLGFSFTALAPKLAELEAAGATITSPMREVQGLFPLAFADDPWGVRLELIEDPQHTGFHHVHLRSPDPETTFQWYLDRFGGVRLPMRGRLDGILYPGNVWILIQRGEVAASDRSTIDHLGWRVPDLESSLTALRSRGSTPEGEARTMQMPEGEIGYTFVPGPDGVRIELVQRAPQMR